MSSFHVPSVPRGLLLPGLDTYEVREEDPVDPTPSGSHWLFHPPPFISDAKLYAETVTIHNPSLWRSASLSGCTLSDRLKRHTYYFPSGYLVPARRSVTLFCCPGKMPLTLLNDLPKNSLLWKNQDGSLRRKAVLNDEGDCVALSDVVGKEMALLDVRGIESRMDEGEACMTLPGVKRLQVLALRTLVLGLCYLRLVFIGLAIALVTTNPDMFLLCTAAVHILDILGRWASRRPGVPMDDFGVVLATMGDRLYALVVLGSLVMLDKDGTHKQLFAGMLALDTTANWLQLSVASASGGSMPLAGGAFVNGRGAAPDFLTHLMLRHPVALTLVSLGNEAFLLGSYVVASSYLPHALRPLLLQAACFITHSGNFLEKEAVGYYCGVGGHHHDEHEIIPPSGDDIVTTPDGFEFNMEDSLVQSEGGVLVGGGDGGDAGFVLGWKAVWMGLMVCCAVRQLLSCIQALISMSTLSSGVIADAAGQDMQRRASRGSRGRSLNRASGEGGGSSKSRARSRSRVR